MFLKWSYYIAEECTISLAYLCWHHCLSFFSNYGLFSTEKKSQILVIFRAYVGKRNLALTQHVNTHEVFRLEKTQFLPHLGHLL